MGCTLACVVLEEILGFLVVFTAIHIRKSDPELNRNIGKMVIPRVFDSLLGIKPKNPRIASLLSQETGSQDIGIGLTQFHSRIDKRVNLCSNRAQRARNFFSN